MTPLVWIIVLNWNGKNHLRDCIGSLSCINYPSYRILFVDNDSCDGSVSFVSEYYPHVCIIENIDNLGFAEGNNVGIRYALSQGADYVVLLNNDTRVDPDFLSALIERGEENKDVGVLGGKILMFYNPRIVNSTGVNLNRFAYGWDRDFGEDAETLQRKGGEVLAVTGCLMAVKKEVFECIGMLDPAFFAYFEDVDFCIRIWKYTDFKVEYVPASVIYHKFSASSSKDSLFKKSLMLRNQQRIFFKHFPIIEILKIFPLFTLHRLALLLHHLIRRQYRLSIMEGLLLLKNCAMLPIIIFSRTFEHKKKTNISSFWDMIIPEINIPAFKAYSPGYEQIILAKDELRGKLLSSRIVMGINDEILGTGWSPLQYEFPRNRRVCHRATCFLINEKRFGFLQMHGFWDDLKYLPLFEVSIEGKSVFRSEMIAGWHSYIIPLDNIFPDGPVEVGLCICSPEHSNSHGKGFGINEIALLPLGSPMLRWMEE
jgi:GT2 family glycosyltransferase